jgi:hypothetical protein
MHKKETWHDDEKRIKVSTLAYACLVIFAVFSLIVCVMIYGTKSQAGVNLAKIFSKVFPMPASIINRTNFVMIDDLEKNTGALIKFYQSPIYQESGIKYNFLSDDGKKQIEIMKKYILNKMIQDKAIDILASKRNISVSESDIKTFMSQKMKDYATQEDVTKMLKDSYGWTIDDFTQNVVIPSVRLNALQDEIMKNEIDNSEAKGKIEAAKTALLKGNDFSSVAEKFSEGQSKNNGGELGWVEKTKMIPELQDAIFGQNALKNNEIIESSIGYHLIEVEGKKKENNLDVVQLRQVFVPKKVFADWLSEQMKNMSILLPLGEFSWNSADQTVEFSDESMKQFEKDQINSPTGITAAMF